MQGSPFAVTIKPRHPPAFCGRVREDVVTWTMQVHNFLSLTTSTNEQQVAYVSTLLQDAAIDWWVALLQERRGKRPKNFEEFAALLEQRFGSTNRVVRARAALRTIQQDRSEGVRSYSARFEELLGKLPSYDDEWAKSQFVWGMQGEIGEMVAIAAPSTLAEAISTAEQVELAKNTVNPGGAQKQPEDMKGHSNEGLVKDADVGPNGKRDASTQCRKCNGFGHWAYQCPSPHMMRGRRGGRCGRNSHNTGAVAVEGTPVAITALAQSEPKVSWGVLQQTPNTPQVSQGGLLGN